MTQSHGVLIASASSTALQSPRDTGQGPPPLHLLKNFPFAAQTGQRFLTDWVRFESEFQNAQAHVHCQTISPLLMPVGIDIRVLTSFDTVESYPVGTPILLSAAGSQSMQISANLGPMVRLQMEILEPTTIYAVLSVWLQPKNV